MITSMINGQDYPYPEEDEEMSDSEEMIKKRVRFLKRCKDRLWKRWTAEYVRGLRERHNQKYNQKQMCPEKGDVVLVHGDERNRGKWTVGVVQKLFEGRDGVVRGVELKTAKSVIDRAVQMLYPLELKVSADTAPQVEEPLNPQAQEFRPRRKAAQAAQGNITQILNFEA